MFVLLTTPRRLQSRSQCETCVHVLIQYKVIFRGDHLSLKRHRERCVISSLSKISNIWISREAFLGIENNYTERAGNVKKCTVPIKSSLWLCCGICEVQPCKWRLGKESGLYLDWFWKTQKPYAWKFGIQAVEIGLTLIIWRGTWLVNL